MSRVVYNRIGKAGSTAMTALIYILSKLNNFQIIQEYNFYPSKEYLTNKLTNLPNNTIYINHCHYIKNLPSDIYWINMMREPIEREQSIFYYDVSYDLRGNKAKEVLLDRSKDKCGCAYFEYDDCIQYRQLNNCTNHIKKVSQKTYFCQPFEVCTADLAFTRARDQYLFVGMNEEFDLTIKALEILLPRFFKNAYEEYLSIKKHKSTHRHPYHPHSSSSSTSYRLSSSIENKALYPENKGDYHTPSINTLTNTSKNGCISDISRKIMIQENIDEISVYKYVRRLFWYKIAQLLPIENFNQLVLATV